MGASQNSEHSGLKMALIQPSANMDGSAISGLMIAEYFRSRNMQVNVIFRSDGPIRRHYEDIGCNVTSLPYDNWLRGGSCIRQLRRVWREYRSSLRLSHYLGDQKIQLVYVNSLTGYAGALAGHRMRIPTIWHLRELFSDVGGEIVTPRGARPFVRCEIARLATAIIAVSQSVMDNIMGRRVCKKAQIIPNAVPRKFGNRRPVAKDAFRRQFGIPSSALLIGALGNVRPVKGYDFLLESFARINDLDVDIAIGGGGDLSSLSKLAVKLGIGKRVHLLKEIEDARSFYHACDLICIPSRSESFGRVAIEAYCAGVPVVATDVGGLSDIVQENETGLLVPYGDHAALTAALKRMLNQPELRKNFVQAGSKLFRSEYHHRTFEERVNQVLVKALSPET
jgi:glycosyltransferase involved in cell wall biosynthesis